MSVLHILISNTGPILVSPFRKYITTLICAVYASPLERMKRRDTIFYNKKNPKQKELALNVIETKICFMHPNSLCCLYFFH
jgi:hypothetical protein